MGFMGAVSEMREHFCEKTPDFVFQLRNPNPNPNPSTSFNPKPDPNHGPNLTITVGLQ